jgi:TolA-binding protein
MFLLSILFAARPQLFAASSAEARAFNAAISDFNLGFYDRAESAFAGFALVYTNSPRLAEAILYQAKARLQQTNYDGAIALISAHQAAAGTNADRYLFWLAEAKFRKGDYQAAAAAFANLVQNYPDSSFRLDAGIGEATARARLADWVAVIRLLNQTNGFFQAAARAQATNELVLRGYLLLGEAELARQDYSAAEMALAPLAGISLAPELDWQQQFLLCRIQLAAGRAEQALDCATRLLALATNAARRDLLAESAAFQAQLLEGLGRSDQAISAYQMNLIAGVPAERQRQALWKVTELSLAQNKTAEAARVLKRFLGQFPATPSADLALLTLSEVRLRQYLSGQDTNAIAATSANAFSETNAMPSALDCLQEFIKRFPNTNSPLYGQAQLDRGWCYWLQTNLPESQAAFQAAAQNLPVSSNQATAYFKLADAQFLRKDFLGAITNYQAVIDKFGGLPYVVTNLWEPALYQIVQAALAAGDLAAATNALAKLLAWYPDGFHTDRALLLTGQEISRLGNPAGARQMFLDFARAAPGAALLPQVLLAVARTYEQQDDWTNAIQQYDRCLSLTNCTVRPEAEYYRAQATYQSRDVTNAFTLFTNFVAHHPTNDLAPRAQMWVADYYFRAGLFIEAERNYKMVFRNTNDWPISELTYQAQMMAGRSAMERSDWGAARGYLTNLYKLADCPTDLRIQALYAYGDCFMSQDSTNKPADYQTANNIFTRIYETYPTNALVALAWGGKANALFQWAKSSVQSGDPAVAYGDVSNAFQQVILATNAPVAARSQAKIGLAIALEKLADQTSATNRTAFLTLALNHCLEVLNGNSILRDGERPDLFWQKEAGLQAGRLAESLQQWPQAIKIYEALAELIPGARARFENNILRCKARLSGSPGSSK